jgi:uncharacterized membrane protein
MKQSRLDGFSDGIFAIIVTLLAIELHVPIIKLHPTDERLWMELTKLWPAFLSFMLSFALIFTYWRAHHFIASVYAREVDTHLTTINALFFFFVALVPFTSRLLAEYSYLQLPIIIYAINILAIGFSLIWMRNYVLGSGHLSHVNVTKDEKRRGLIRVVVPMVCAVAAIGICFYSTSGAFVLLTFAIIFNLMSRSTRVVNQIIKTAQKEIKTK